MNNAHASGATIGALAGFLSARYGWNVSDTEAYAFGAAVASIGALVAHAVSGPGLVPAIRRALLGPAKEKVTSDPPPAV